MNKVKILPWTQREHQIVKALGQCNWEVLEERDQILCLKNQPGVLIAKEGHTRWIRAHQVTQMKEERNA